MEVMEAMALRQSCRNFTQQKVTKQQIERILLAANAAPVARGLFSEVHLTVVTDEGILAELERAAGALQGKPDAHPLYGSTTLIVVSVPEEGGESICGCNAGCIVENMTLAAVDQGLSSVYIYGMLRALRESDSDVAKQALKKLALPEGFVAISSLAVGFPAHTETPREITLDKIATDYLA